MIISFQQHGCLLEKDDITLPQLAPISSNESSSKDDSNSSDTSNKSWVERLICSMDEAADYYACGARGNEVPVKPASTVAIDEDSLACNSHDNDAPVISDIEASTYDFAALLTLLEEQQSKEHNNAQPSSPLHLVRSLLQHDQWSSVFDSMSPNEYASFITTFDSEFDPPEIAALVAPSVNDGELTHEYIVAVVRAAEDWSRASLIAKLLPLCSDGRGNSGKIKAELSEWDVVCTRGAFDMVS